MDKLETRWNLSQALKQLCKNDSTCLSSKLSRYLKLNKWKPSDRQNLLSEIATLFLDPQCTAKICCYLRPLALDIAERILYNILQDVEPNHSRQHIHLTVALGVAVKVCADLKSFTKNYLVKYRPLTSGDELKEPKKKKAKRDNLSEVTLCRTVWYLVDALGTDIKEYLPLDRLLNNLSSDSQDVRWFSVMSVSRLLNMSNHEKELFIKKYFTVEEERELIIRDFTEEENFKAKYLKFTVAIPMETTDTKSPNRTLQQILDSDLHANITQVCGVLLPRLCEFKEQLEHNKLVPVASMLDNLRSLALAVAAGSPILLQGPVGSGKTSIVEYLAHLTGRHCSPHLMKIQLGDQTDSKALLGIYRCTEIPGEFVWQPGILTQAVLEGHWVLLEDIDYAPMDVVSVLLPLLENHTLSVPGHGDNIKASPNFRLFATQRLIGSGTGWHNQKSGSSVLLEKMWTKIHVAPLSRGELAEVIVSRYPTLQSIVQRILDIYFLLSVGKHDTTDNNTSLEVDTAGKFISLDGRLISTRDLMTWCGRISVDFDVQSPAVASKVFQEALDCFVSCLSKPEKYIAVAEAIGAKLNIPKLKAEYFSSKYKPDIEITPQMFNVGRVSIPKKQCLNIPMSNSYSTFSFTRQSVCLLEKVGVCLMRNEPVLLVGETGTGKTSSVQFLAQQLGHKLHVVNMNQQSDSTDLLGGFKPVDIRFLIMPFREEFEILFCQSFSRKQNAKFLGHIQDCFSKRKWSDLLQLVAHTCKSAVKKFENDETMLTKWKAVEKRAQQLQIQIKQTENVLAFTFIEGTLVKAIRQGDWVLLDEINLASAETLECLCGLLESTTGSIILTERGDIEPIVRHENFRLFACMNPATDVGKKDLTPGIRNRFTEFYVEELTDESDLRILINDYLSGLALTANHLSGIVKFYTVVRKTASKSLVDGTGHKPHYSLRTLCRALRYASCNPCGQSSRSLYEGFCLSFLTQLDRKSHPIVEQLVCKHVIGNTDVKSMLSHNLPEPSNGKHLLFEGYWIPKGPLEPLPPESYILTPSVRANLKDLARIVSAGQHPVLLQGETSVGKTSLITWLAKSTGNVCVRVNNHEHTDLQEYVGCYAADEAGKLVFKEGVLVEAMRKGHWIILDELNLAPSDVLEALNRLLDDNRELFIPETQLTVKAHKKFTLFATQNPAGQYGGRKILSRAFRNRFIELHFDEIPSAELETILHLRCTIPLSYAKRLVAVMLELQTRRRSSGVFAGKQGFMTLRDLFRWAERYNARDISSAKKYYDWDQHLADHGYMLLAGRVRKPDECDVIQEVIVKHFKRKVNPDNLFSLNKKTSSTTDSLLKSVLGQSLASFEHVVWTYNMRRLAVLIGQAIQFKEPVLLVGETGCGKTTICQLYAALKESQLYGVNCHLHTESSDFLGGLRPVRFHSMEEDEDHKEHKLFEWVDGPLVLAMKESAMFLIDEISLADDSVLERLNSVLEPERRLLLAEKGGGDGDQNQSEDVVAGEGFRIFATMNPGGDYGKKELSPALRNRFTEIWCPPARRREDMVEIIEHNLKSGVHLSNQQDGSSGIGPAIMDFIEWFTNNEMGKRCTVSIRDILSWVNFINVCSVKEDDISDDNGGYLDAGVAYVHGACLVFLDSLGSGVTSGGSESSASTAKQACVDFLMEQICKLSGHQYTQDELGLGHGTRQKLDVKSSEASFSIPPFTILRGPYVCGNSEKYALKAPTTCLNALRVLRGLQLSRPLLLEGSPGVGKTSLVSAIARNAGRQLVRINLSEQTDVTDLFGADLPVEGEKGGTFAWRDGPFLQALKAGHWVVLDELNLASQSVLEGLNACLDHRGEVYIPELGKTFQIKEDETRIFGCQNPLHQGGGRKGLPRSFLNRFTQVYIEPLRREDLLFIAASMYPTIPQILLEKMVDFNMAMHMETTELKQWGSKGGPWEFNLRDLFRWCDLLLSNQVYGRFKAGEYMSLIYSDRMRTVQDEQRVYDLFSSFFKDIEGEKGYMSTRCVTVSEEMIQVGHSFLPRVESTSLTSSSSSLKLLHQNLQPLESVMKCVEMNWMAILVGPQACGKTSLISLLAEVTGNPLHILPMNSSMDTTELLGGFEQADVCRHLEEISSDVINLISKYQKNTLTCRQTVKTSSIQHLHQLWSQYSAIKLTGEETSSLEEYNLLIKRTTSLKYVTDRIKAYVQDSWNDEVRSLSERLARVEETILKNEPGKGGGAFEWVDSLLVKALTDGHWLLIDNVNFCSPSVLDRLNALLEPNGVLSINERGVIDGCIPTIHPHPNFRLFLAMDPRYGEISRAMRNRGVEIYIPGEFDNCPYSNSDIRSMLSGIGLDKKRVCDWLIHVQEEMKNCLPLAEKPSINDMLRCALVVGQQLERGVVLQTALKQAGLNVYINSLKNSTTKKVAAEIFNRTLSEKFVSEEIELSPLVWPGTKKLNKSVTLYNTAQAAGVISHLLTQINSQFIRASQDKLEIDTEEVDRLTHAMLSALTLFVSQTTHKDWQFTKEWFQAFIDQQKSWDNSQNKTGRLGYSLQQMRANLPQFINKTLDSVYSTKVVRQFQDLMKTVCYANDSSLYLLLDQPWDLSHNKQILEKIHFLNPQTEDFYARVDDMMLLTYRQHMIIDVIVLLKKCSNWMAFLEKAATKASTLPSSPMYVLVHVENLCTKIENVMISALTDQMSLSTKTLYQFWDNLPHMSNFLCEVQALKNYPEAIFLSRLSLHWNWLYNKLLAPVLASTTWSAPSRIQSILFTLQNILGQDNLAAKQFMKYLTAYSHPKPFKTEAETEIHSDIRLCQDALNVDISGSTSVVEAKVTAIVTDGLHLHRQLMSVFEALHLSEDNHETVCERLQSLRIALIEKGIFEEQFESMETDNEKETKIVNGHKKKQHVELWPLFEHTSLMCEYSILTRREDFKSVKNLTDFMLKYVPTSPVHILEDQLSEQQWNTDLCGVIMERMWSCAATNNCNKWLKWNQQHDVEEDVIKERSKGPGRLHLMPLSYPLFTMLSSKPNPKETSYLPLHVPLGGVHEQLDKLSQISAHVWSSNGVLSSPRFDIRYLERQHLNASFIKMLGAFGALLHKDHEKHWNDVMIELFTRQKTKTLKQDDILTIQALFQEVVSAVDHPAVALISRCFEIMSDQGIWQTPSLNSVNIGLGLAYVGLSSAYLLAPVGPVDPIEKQTIKLNNYQNRLKEIEVEISVFEVHHKLKTGQSISNIEPENLHIRLQYLLDRKIYLTDEMEKLKEQQAHRPDPIKFQGLIHDVKAFLGSVGSVERVTSLLSKLQTTSQQLKEGRGDGLSATTGLREEESWQKSVHSFMNGIDKEYWYYPDLISGFIVSVQQMSFGISILAQKVETEQKQLTFPKEIYGQRLDDVVLILSQFPSLSRNHEGFHDLTRCLIYDTTSDLVSASLFQSEKEERSHEVLSKLLMCALHLIKLHCIHQGELTAEITQTLSNLFGAFVSAWQDQEDRRKKREAEEASLYRFRSKTHGDKRTEEEQDESEFKSSFPSFEKEYSDLVGAKTLEDVGIIDEEEDIVTTSLGSITVREMYTVYKIHDFLFASLVKTDWLSPKPLDECTPDLYLEPAMLGYSIAAQIGQTSLGALGNDVDLSITGGHLIISGVVQQTMLSSLQSDSTSQGSSLCLTPSEFYDVYYDSNVAEVSQCKGVLDRFIVRINELLTEFPEHPTLMKMMAIIERILSFSITCPIMKFLVGLELLLEKSKDWEANAAKHVSVMPNFTEVSAMVVQWRKLELGCWKNTMLLEERKCEKSVSKWWFHLYQLITSYLQPEINKEASVDSVELLTSLKQFLEKSNLGEFKCRLKMVYAFHCQVYKMDTSDKQVEVMNMLWNLYQFYYQYLPNIEAEIVSQKAPLQKQLKGFVKIARWSDLNYWALKQSTEKTHRTIHKFAKKYQAILNQPITKLLGEKGDNLAIMTPGDQSEGSSLCEKLEVYRQMVIAKKQNKLTLLNIEGIDISEIQSRLPMLIPRLGKHWKSVVTSLNYTQLLSSLNQFTGDIIENVHELQQAEIPKGDDKEKQKKEAKFLNLRKRKSLAELFKYLTKMGLSYRKGLVIEEDTQQLDTLSLQPLEVKAALTKHNSFGGEVLSSQWQNCQDYFYRCITRKAQLDLAILQPAADLGLNNIERCRGFSYHLHHLFTKQRHELGETFNSFITLRKIMCELEIINKTDQVTLPPQNQLKYWLDRLKCLSVQLLEGLNQYLLLLEAAPKHRNDGNDYISPLLKEELSSMAMVKHGDPLWLQCVNAVKEILQVAAAEHKKLLKLSDRFFLIWKDFDIVEDSAIKLKSCSDKLFEISQLFKDPMSGSSCALNEPLDILGENINDCSDGFQQFRDVSKNLSVNNDDLTSESVKNITSNMDKLIENILLVVQKLLSYHSTESSDKDKSTSQLNEDEEEETDYVSQGHLVKRLIGDLNADVSQLKAKQISSLVLSLIEKIQNLFNEKLTIGGKTSLTLLLRCYPLLQKYCDITEFYLAHVISSHRTSGKLLSVLLALFTELAMKGFCVPPELSDEMEKEGATDFQDIEQGGLGDGEGVKDVSDQIETEDQLDEARKPGEEKKEEDKNPDVAPEDNAIEMSEDFEGKPQDLDENDDDDKDDNDGEDEDELEKQMGDLDEEDADKLDEELWGSDEEEEFEDNEKDDETGPGDGEREEQLVAKDDNKDKSTDDRDQKDEENNQQTEEKEDQINEMEDMEEEGYNEDKVDPKQGDNNEPELVPETMDLPDELNLDDAEGGEKEEETEMEDPGDGEEDEGETKEEETPDVKDEDETKDESKEEGEEDKEEKDGESKKDDKTDEKGEEEEKEEEGGQGEEKDVENGEDDDKKDEEEKGDAGFTADDDEEKDEGKDGEEKKDEEDKEEEATDVEAQGKTSHDAPNVEESETAQDDASKADNEQQEKVGSGLADTQQDEGHEGEKSAEVTEGSSEKKKEKKRQPGKSDEDRSLGTKDQTYKRLKTSDETKPDEEVEEKNQEKKEGDIYEHIKDAKSHHDAQTLDVATEEQQEKQTIPATEEEEDKQEEPTDDAKPEDEDEKQEEEMEVEKKDANKVWGKKSEQGPDEMNSDMKMEDGEEEDEEKVKIEGEKVLTMTVARGPESTIHTALEHLHLDQMNEIDVEKIRADLEENVTLWSHQSFTTPEQIMEASLAWQKYEAITSSLSQELCEQLRLVLEPSQATKLKGDYRTGKRLNMRKVIPYIASQFRKDKIWLRRTKPSKRQYQIMLAIDDSSSMLDNHSKQLAFESLALISNALTLLESGDLAVSSFGESVKLLHSFTDQFSSQSGANILHQFTFEQKKTKIAQLLQQVTSIMVDARSRQHGSVGNPETSQLLLIVSDGRGLFSEGMEVVKDSVRKAREANIFLVFVIIDNPEAKDSILDIRVPVFKGLGKLPEIKTYMEEFPFPFYIILRDINTLPTVLSDALRQWFELVTAGDR